VTLTPGARVGPPNSGRGGNSRETRFFLPGVVYIRRSRGLAAPGPPGLQEDDWEPAARAETKPGQTGTKISKVRKKKVAADPKV